MKTRSIIFFLLYLSISFAQKNDTHFKSELDFGNGTIFSTFLDLAVDQGQFTITSPKNADLRIVGGKARLGRLLGKFPKKGTIIKIHGVQKADSLSGETTIPMFGKLKFRGAVKDNTLTGKLLNGDAATVGTMHGLVSAEDKIDYRPLYPKLMKTIKDNIYSTSVLKTKEWAAFEKKIEKLCREAHDDIELYFGINMLAQKLPFSHLSFVITKDEEEEEQEEKPQEEPANAAQSVIFEEKNSATAYLGIKNFSSSQKELAAILPKIVANKAYKNLIIDLRDNGGGGLSAAFELAKYMVADDLEVGYFVTNKLQYSGFEPGLFKTLPEVQPKSTMDFGDDLKKLPGVKLIFKKPDNPVFQGNIYVLTNGSTGSTCEPVVYALKSTKKATIIGQKTYGGMLAASPFFVSGKYLLWLPIADFYTYDGVRLEGMGVMPHIEVKSEDALQKALALINNQKSN